MQTTPPAQRFTTVNGHRLASRVGLSHAQCAAAFLPLASRCARVRRRRLHPRSPGGKTSLGPSLWPPQRRHGAAGRRSLARTGPLLRPAHARGTRDGGESHRVGRRPVRRRAPLRCLPGGRDTILATLDDEGFVLESMAPQRSATPMSMAAHSLLRAERPVRHHRAEVSLVVRDVPAAGRAFPAGSRDAVSARWPHPDAAWWLDGSTTSRRCRSCSTASGPRPKRSSASITREAASRGARRRRPPHTAPCRRAARPWADPSR